MTPKLEMTVDDAADHLDHERFLDALADLAIELTQQRRTQADIVSERVVA